MSHERAKLDRARDFGTIHGDHPARFHQDNKYFDAQGVEITNLEIDTAVAARAPAEEEAAQQPEGGYEAMSMVELRAAKKAHPMGNGKGFPVGTNKAQMIESMKALDTTAA